MQMREQAGQIIFELRKYIGDSEPYILLQGDIRNRTSRSSPKGIEAKGIS